MTIKPELLTPDDLLSFRDSLLTEVKQLITDAKLAQTGTGTGTTPVSTPTPTPDPAPTSAARANADNTGPRVQLTSSTATTISAGQTVSGKRFTNYVQMTGGTAVDCEFTRGVILLGSDPSISWSLINGLSISSADRPRISNCELTGNGDLIHLTSDQRSTAPYDMVIDAVLDTVWAHRTGTPQQGSHVDGMQVRGVQGLTLRNSVLDLGAWVLGPDGADALNAALFIEPANGGQSGVLIDNCYLNGGGITFRYAGTTGGKFEVTNTDLGPDFKYAQQYKTSDRGATTAPTKQLSNRQQGKDGSWSSITFV